MAEYVLIYDVRLASEQNLSIDRIALPCEAVNLMSDLQARGDKNPLKAFYPLHTFEREVATSEFCQKRLYHPDIGWKIISGN